MAKRVQRKRVKGWMLPINAIYVGRPGKYGNPFTTEKFGEDAVSLYEQVLKRHTMRLPPEIARYYSIPTDEDILELRGKDLACWCRLCDKHSDGLPLGVICDACSPCHADILLELANV